MLKFITISMFNLAGWKLEGELPPGIKKCILIAGPHTSNFDFFFAMAGFYKHNLPVKVLIKKEWAEFFLFRRLLKNAGIMGVNRKKSTTMVDTLADLIVKRDEDIAVMIAPEGTRKLARKWKTGFYYAALKANVPIYLSHLDYAKKEAVLGPGFMPTGDFKKDMEIVKNHYKDVTPKYPENFCLKIYLDDESEACPENIRK